MSINVERAETLELGEYRKVVNQIRDSEIADDILIKALKVDGRLLILIRKVISDHPDWNDEEVAEEVLSMED